MTNFSEDRDQGCRLVHRILIKVCGTALELPVFLFISASVGEKKEGVRVFYTGIVTSAPHKVTDFHKPSNNIQHTLTWTMNRGQGGSHKALRKRRHWRLKRRLRGLKMERKEI